MLLPLQPIERLREVLATADVAVSVIEPDAGAFSVPSKVQSYLCAGRAVLLAAPAGNLAARVVRAQAAGVVIEPEDRAGFVRGGARALGRRGGAAGDGCAGAGAMRSGPTTWSGWRTGSRK